ANPTVSLDLAHDGRIQGSSEEFLPSLLAGSTLAPTPTPSQEKPVSAHPLPASTQPPPRLLDHVRQVARTRFGQDGPGERWSSAAGPAARISSRPKQSCRPRLLERLVRRRALECPRGSNHSLLAWPGGSQPHARRRVAHRKTNLVSAGRTFGFLAEVEEELVVQLETALLGVGIEAQHERTMLSNVRVELIIPAADERVGHVEPLAIEAELQHLRAAAGRRVPELGGLSDHPAHPDLTRQFGFRRAPNVVLADVAVQPVGEVEPAGVHPADECA